MHGEPFFCSFFFSLETSNIGRLRRCHDAPLAPSDGRPRLLSSLGNAAHTVRNSLESGVCVFFFVMPMHGSFQSSLFIHREAESRSVDNYIHAQHLTRAPLGHPKRAPLWGAGGRFCLLPNSQTNEVGETPTKSSQRVLCESISKISLKRPQTRSMSGHR